MGIESVRVRKVFFFAEVAALIICSSTYRLDDGFPRCIREIRNPRAACQRPERVELQIFKAATSAGSGKKCMWVQKEQRGLHKPQAITGPIYIHSVYILVCGLSGYIA